MLIQSASLLALSVLAIVCVAGVWSNKFQDNWLQFIGLITVTTWAGWRLVDVAGGAHITAQQLFAHAGLAAFAAGTAWKFWRQPPPAS